MTDDKILLVHAIMLLYWESQLEDTTVDNSDLVVEALDNIKIPEVSLGGDDTAKQLNGLVHTARYFCERKNKENKLDREVLIQRLKLLIGDDPIIEVVESGLGGGDDSTAIRKKCSEYIHTINSFVNDNRFRDMLKRQFADQIYNHNDTGSVRERAQSLISQLEPFQSHADSEEQGVKAIQGVVDVVNMADTDALQELFKAAEEENSTDGIIQLGFQGLNRIFGAHKGIRRGDFGAIAAFQHNFKSGLTLKMFKHAALYNTPYMIDENKKPMLLYISSENKMTDNLMILYSDLWENEYGERCDTTNIDYAEASAYIKDRLSVNGYHIELLRVNPSDMGFRELFRVIMYYEAQGFEIHMCVMDYLNMLSKEGCSQGPTGSETRDLFRRVRNFMSVRKIAFVTPHQISTEAKYLLRQDIPLIVKEFPNKSYWDSCKTLDQEIDWGLWIHIEIYKGKSYLTIARDKHRGVFPVTPEEDKFTILPFFDVGSVRDDIHGEDLSMSKLPTLGDEDDW